MIEPSPARTTYSRAVIVSLWVALLFLGPVFFLAWLQHGHAFWLVAGLTLVIGVVTALVLVHRAELLIDDDGVLRLRATVRRQADLRRLDRVEMTPFSVAHDQLMLRDPAHWARVRRYVGFLVTDVDGGRVRFAAAPRMQWRDPSPILARLIEAVERSDATCSPQCWELLHVMSGRHPAPFPERLTEVDPHSWGVLIRPAPANRRNDIRLLGAFGVVAPLLLGAVGVLGVSAGVSDPVVVTFAVAGAPIATIVAIRLVMVDRLACGAGTRIEADGRAEQREHMAAGAQWSRRVHEGAVDLRRLQEVRFEPIGSVHRTHGAPPWWRLVVEDRDDGRVVLPLRYERDPPVALFPQLCSFIEASGLPLDEATHRGLGLRLGRPMSNPLSDG